MTAGGDEHLEWRISALLDGELGVTDEIVAREHLERCARCQDEFAQVMAARSLVRDLGEVEPPQGFLERALPGERSRFSPRLGLVGLVAVAAAWVLILAVGLGVALPDVSPPVDEFADQHAEVADATETSPTLPERSDGLQRLSPEEVSDLDAPFVVPDAIDPFERVAAYAGEGTVQVLYADREREVSVFQQEGSLDWDELPAEGRRDDPDVGRAWVGTVETPSGPAAVAVVPRGGDIVYTVIATSPEEAWQVAERLPPPRDYSIAERTKRNLEGVARRLGFGRVDPAPGP